MMASGYPLRTNGSGIASLMTIPGSVSIIVAFRLAHRCQPSPSATTNGTALLSVRATMRFLGSMGLPNNLPLGPRIVALSLMLISGATMMLAGYTWGRHGWPLTAMLAVVGGLVIGAAFTTVAASLSANAAGR